MIYFLCFRPLLPKSLSEQTFVSVSAIVFTLMFRYSKF